jgi:hypothetical protein
MDQSSYQLVLVALPLHLAAGIFLKSNPAFHFAVALKRNTSRVRKK